MIREATSADIPFLLAVARARYPAFDERATIAWLHQALTIPHVRVVRGDYGGGVGIVTRPFHGGPSRAHMLFTVTLPNRRMEGYFIIKALDEWRREMGAESLHFGSDTGVDFAPFARRLGAVEERPSYRIDGGHAAVERLPPASSARKFDVLEYALTRVA